jgi:phage-related protein
MPLRIEFYSTASDRSPVEDYIEQAERRRKERARIVRTFETLQVLPQPPPSMFKKMKGSDLWEIKVGSHRFLGYRPTPDRLVLLHGFAKQSQKTPLHEIEVALRRLGLHSAAS